MRCFRNIAAVKPVGRLAIDYCTVENNFVMPVPGADPQER
jgi:hypothetical protein